MVAQIGIAGRRQRSKTPAGASSRLRVFAMFGSDSPLALLPTARVLAPGASSSVSSVASALAADASVAWWGGGSSTVHLAGRFASRSVVLVSAVGRGVLSRSPRARASAGPSGVLPVWWGSWAPLNSAESGGFLQLELRRYVRREGLAREQDPYWHFQIHENGECKKLYLGKIGDQ